MEFITDSLGKLRLSRNSSGSDSSSDDYSYRRNNYKQTDSGGRDYKQFGYYKCPDCGRGWQSAYSWKSFGQKCKGCGTMVMAYRREDLIRSEENKIDSSKPHLKHLCAKCKRYGDCTRRY